MLNLAVLGNWQVLVGILLLCFAISFGELSASQMALPPGIDTVPRVTLGLLHAGVNERTAAITIVSAALIVCVSASGWMFVCLKPSKISRK